jgi:hypothetical protein
MEEYEGGVVKGENGESWTYTKGINNSLDSTNSFKEDLCAKWKSVTDEIVEFSCKDHQFTFIDPVYGSVAWNNKSWIWTHPRCPFVIRYDWYPSKGVFKQKMPKKGGPNAVKNMSGNFLIPAVYVMLCKN